MSITKKKYHKKEIYAWLKKYSDLVNIEELCVINSNFSVDIKYDISIYGKGLSELPFKFNKVGGVFNAGHNLFTDLKNFPKEAKEIKVHNTYTLTSLEGLDKKYDGKLYIENCPNLLDYYGKPENVKFDYNPLKRDGFCWLEYRSFDSTVDTSGVYWSNVSINTHQNIILKIQDIAIKQLNLVSNNKPRFIYFVNLLSKNHPHILEFLLEDIVKIMNELNIEHPSISERIKKLYTKIGKQNKRMPLL